MERLLTRCGPTRRLGFFVVVPAASPSVKKLLQAAPSFLAWSLPIPVGEYAFVAGSDYYHPRRYVTPHEDEAGKGGGGEGGGGDGILLLALLSKGARATACASTYQLTPVRQRLLLEAFASFKHEAARDALGPPPADLTRPASVRGQEAEEWWW